MANLYEINRELIQLMDGAFDPETGEINEELYAQFDALQLEKSEKIEQLACWVKNLVSDAKQVKEEAKALSERAKSYERKADSITKYIEDNLNGEKFKTSKCEITWRKSETVECDLEDITVLPMDYIRYKEPELNKAEIKKALKAGEFVEGCHLEEHMNMGIK